MIWVCPKCNHMYPYKIETEGYLTDQKSRKQYDCGGRNWRDAMASLGMLTGTRS